LKKAFLLFFLAISLFGKFMLINVNFEGNKFFSNKELLKRVESKPGVEYNEYALRHDEIKLIRLYKDNGFFDINIKKYIKVNFKKKGISIVFKIIEGLRYPVLEIRILGNRSIPIQSILPLLKIKKNNPYSALYSTLSGYAIMDYYSRNGYPYTNITDTFSVSKGKGVIIRYLIDEGKRVFIRRIIVENKSGIRDKVIHKYTKRLKSGEIYNPEKVNQVKKELLQTYLFERIEVKTEGLALRSDSVNIIFNILSSKRTEIAIGGGIQSLEWVVGKTRLTQKGLFSGEHSLKFELEQGFNVKGGLRTNIFTKFKSKDILLTPLSFILTYTLTSERTDTALRYEDLETKLGYTKNNKYGIYLSYIYKQETSSFRKSISRILSHHIESDNRDNMLDPKKGIKTQVTFYKGGGFLGGDENFYKYDFSIATYLNIKRIVLENYFKRGNIIYHSLPSYTNLFHLDGINILRGYKEYEYGDTLDTLTGRWYLKEFNHFTFQPKFLITRGLYLVTFVDFLLLHSEFLKTYGIGVHYSTPIGPIRLEFGFGDGHKNLIFSIGEMIQ